MYVSSVLCPPSEPGGGTLETYHSDPKYRDRFYINIEYKRSLHFGAEGVLLNPFGTAQSRFGANLL